MAAPSKTKKIEQLVKLLQKRYKNISAPRERPVLDRLIYAALLENASEEQADAAFVVLENYFIDWNEIRVSTVGELADVFNMLPNPLAAGERVRRALQMVFERTYRFDLEDICKKNKNLGQAVEFLESLGVCSRFMIDYVTQNAFGGHVIPIDEASMRIFRLLGLTHVNKDRTREEVAGLERAIPKKNGQTFAAQLHGFGVEFYTDPESQDVRVLLKSIDPEVLQRDWTPPVLQVPRALPKTPIVPPKVAMPFVATDDDDFDEEHGGTEAEFISEDGEIDSVVVVKIESKAERKPEQRSTIKVEQKTDSKAVPKTAPPKPVLPKETVERSSETKIKPEKSTPKKDSTTKKRPEKSAEKSEKAKPIPKKKPAPDKPAKVVKKTTLKKKPK